MGYILQEYIILEMNPSTSAVQRGCIVVWSGAAWALATTIWRRCIVQSGAIWALATAVWRGCIVRIIQQLQKGRSRSRFTASFSFYGCRQGHQLSVSCCNVQRCKIRFKHNLHSVVLLHKTFQLDLGHYGSGRGEQNFGEMRDHTASNLDNELLGINYVGFIFLLLSCFQQFFGFLVVHLKLFPAKESYVSLGHHGWSNGWGREKGSECLLANKEVLCAWFKLWKRSMLDCPYCCHPLWMSLHYATDKTSPTAMRIGSSDDVKQLF